MTPAEYFEGLKGKLTADKAQAIGAVYQFNVTGDDGGTWVMDLTKDADFVSEGAGDAQCTITVTSSDFIDMVQGRLPGPQAFMMGKLKIEGNMGLAMKLSSVLA